MFHDNQIQASICESITSLIGDIDEQLEKTSISTVDILLDDLHKKDFPEKEPTKKKWLVRCHEIQKSLNSWLEQLEGINFDELRRAGWESFIKKFQDQISSSVSQITQKQVMIEQELKQYQSIVSYKPTYDKCSTEGLAASESPVEKGYSSDDELVLALEARKMSHIETRQYHQTQDDASCSKIRDLCRRLDLRNHKIQELRQRLDFRDQKIQELRQRLQAEVEKNRELQSILDGIQDLLLK